MSAPLQEPALRADVDMVTTLHVGPGGLDRFLDLVADGRGPLIKYQDGSLTLVSPSQRHERSAERIDGLIKGVCAVLGIGYIATASTLFRRPGHDHGIEADKTYYFAHAADARGAGDEIDLSIVPPPDLAVEVAATHEPTKSLRICQELAIPEVWIFRVKRRTLEVLQLDDQGRYVASATSRAFPFLTSADALPWISEALDERDDLWESRLRAWVRDVLGPRRD